MRDEVWLHVRPKEEHLDSFLKGEPVSTSAAQHERDIHANQSVIGSLGWSEMHEEQMSAD